MKKVTSIILVFVMLFSIMNIIVLAKGGATGLIVDKWEDLVNSEYESTFRASSKLRAGDLNGDGWVTSLDVRECLQIIADLDTTFDIQRNEAADVNCDGIISILDARTIMQIVAEMKTGCIVAETTLGDTAFDGLVIGPLESSAISYFWQCDFDESALEFSDKTFNNNPPEVLGGPVNHYFLFKPNKPGTYTITFKLADVHQKEVIDEFECILIVK